MQIWRTQQEQAEKFRARLQQVPRFEPRRLPSTRPESAPTRQMEYRPQIARIADRPEITADLPEMPQLTPPELADRLRPFAIAARPDTFSPEMSERQAERAMASTRAIWDSLRGESLDLLRVEDLAAAGNRPAVVLIDPTARRDVTGFVTLRRLRLRGAGGGRVGLDALARHMRDHTDLLVQVKAQSDDYFLSADLLADPIHFLIDGGGLPIVGEWPPLQVGEQEKSMMRRYIQGGGLLFFEGSNSYLQQAVQLLQELIGADGGMRPMPPSHDLYHAFFDFDAGFPSEVKGIYSMLEGRPTAWIYPVRGPDESAAPAAANVNPDLEGTSTESPQTPFGLWEVLYKGRTAAILSDIKLHEAWMAAWAVDENVSISAQSGPKLAAGINLIVYALTRDGGNAVRRALPAWIKQRPAVKSSAAIDDPERPLDPDEGFDTSLYDELTGSVAVVVSPLGDVLGPGSIRIRVAGHEVELFRDELNGALLSNLPPGDHWVEVTWQGKTESAPVVVSGGQVSTVTIAVQRLAMLQRIVVEAQPDVVGHDDWMRTFDDLNVEEIFLGGESGFGIE